MTRPAVAAAGWAPAAATAALVSAGYVDPGNWGTDVAAGGQAGGRLLWVLALALAAAFFLQQLAVRVTLGSGRDLPQLLAELLPQPVRALVMAAILIALAVTEIVEVFGIQIALGLATGWPAPVTTVGAFALIVLLLALPTRFGRWATYLCLGLIGVVYLGFFLTHTAQTAAGLRPGGLDHAQIPLCLGLVGAVVMPHNLLLQSMLARHDATRNRLQPRLFLRRTGVTTAVALLGAFVLNASITLLAHHAPGTAGDLGGTFTALRNGWGGALAMLFALTLLASGLGSSVTGGLASADVLERWIPRLTVPAWQRRICCLIPAGGMALAGLPATTVLVDSQILLAATLPAVLVPLIWFASRRGIAGSLALRLPGAIVGGGLVAGLIVAGCASLA